MCVSTTSVAKSPTAVRLAPAEPARALSRASLLDGAPLLPTGLLLLTGP